MATDAPLLPRQPRWTTLLKRLATLKTRQALRYLGEDVEIGFDEGWYHRVGAYFVPDGPCFVYTRQTILTWGDEITNYYRNAEDFWFASYEPKAGDVVIDVGAGRGAS